MGDFNINLLDYSTSPPVENFLNFMISHNYYPVITLPTRVTPLSCTLIENIFSNRVDEKESTEVITTNISDHSLSNILQGVKAITCRQCIIN